MSACSCCGIAAWRPRLCLLTTNTAIKMAATITNETPARIAPSFHPISTSGKQKFTPPITVASSWSIYSGHCNQFTNEKSCSMYNNSPWVVLVSVTPSQFRTQGPLLINPGSSEIFNFKMTDIFVMSRTSTGAPIITR